MCCKSFGPASPEKEDHGVLGLVPPTTCGLQVFQLAAHLVYWGKAVIIYPLCENNVYVLSPNASVCL